MKKSNFQLNSEICKAFDLEWYQVWITSRILYDPTVEEVRRMLEATDPEDNPARRAVYDCDAFSSHLLADQKLWVAENNFNIPWSFFRVIGIRCRGVIMNHSWNMVSTQSGIYFCESMNYVDRLWKFESLDKDQIIMAHT